MDMMSHDTFPDFCSEFSEGSRLYFTYVFILYFIVEIHGMWMRRQTTAWAIVHCTRHLTFGRQIWHRQFGSTKFALTGCILIFMPEVGPVLFSPPMVQVLIFWHMVYSSNVGDHCNDRWLSTVLSPHARHLDTVHWLLVQLKRWTAVFPISGKVEASRIWLRWCRGRWHTLRLLLLVMILR